MSLVLLKQFQFDCEETQPLSMLRQLYLIKCWFHKRADEYS